jgi:hypothetical protein
VTDGVISDATTRTAPLGLRDRAEPGATVLTDEQVVAMAAVVWVGAVLGARHGSPVPLVLASAVATLGVITARSPLLLIGALAMALALGHRADVAYEPLPAGRYQGEATVVSDPRPSGPATRVEVALANGKRVEARAFGSAGATLARVTSGDHLVLSGGLRPISESSWTRSRHLVGRMTVDEATGIRGPER